MKLNYRFEGKFYDAERDRKHKQHLERLSSIASKKNVFFTVEGPLPSRINSNAHKKKTKREMQQENQRLSRRLIQIEKRKNNFIIQNEQQKYYSQNIKYRQIVRNKQLEKIQLENDYIVERIVDQTNRHHSVIEIKNTEEESKIKQKHNPNKYQYKRNKSLMLPQIQIPLLNQIFSRAK